ncbi:ferritin-like domain-containing protein [Kineococcus rhizosphaerae]|uniref:Uncharacterized protein DUF4439 n=1 Tax=Kineococcus rhizosphaerae TaxID=559628 RepID=A0A2T0RBN2_9ACTN|nr:ferritin-like domain-containing protein [Kineococcus rhizosphaerae]PRY18551.1 uncharacterized protein DUF4439 [Kineococcus rhizosphaerae]
MPRPRPVPLSRRALLGPLAAVALGVSGCGVRWVPGPEATPTAQPGPDDDAREAAVASSRDLLTLLSSAATGAEPLRTAALQGVQVVQAHLVALGGDPATPTPTGPATDAGTVADRLATGAGTVLALATSTGAVVGGATARLLVSLAASRAVLADAVAAATGTGPAPDPVPPTGEPTPAPPAPTTATTPAGPPTGEAENPGTAALQRALAGEHAAVHGYALVVARLPEPRRTEAAGDLQAHRTARDDLVDLLTARGATPVQAAAGYDVAAPTAQAALALAASMDERLATLYADVVAASTPDRDACGRAVLTAARRAHRWGSSVLAFPGSPELGEDGSPAPTTEPAGSPTTSRTP